MDKPDNLRSQSLSFQPFEETETSTINLKTGHRNPKVTQKSLIFFLLPLTTSIYTTHLMNNLIFHLIALKVFFLILQFNITSQGIDFQTRLGCDKLVKHFIRITTSLLEFIKYTTVFQTKQFIKLTNYVNPSKLTTKWIITNYTSKWIITSQTLNIDWRIISSGKFR